MLLAPVIVLLISTVPETPLEHFSAVELFKCQLAGTFASSEKFVGFACEESSFVATVEYVAVWFSS